MNKLRNFLLKTVVRRSLPHLHSVRHSCGEGRSGRGLVVGVYQKEGDKDPKLTPTGEKVNDRVQGKLNELICETKITGRLGRGKVFNNIDQEFRSLAIVGVGLEGIGFNELEMLDEGMENVRVAAGIGARSLQVRFRWQGLVVSKIKYSECKSLGDRRH